MKKHDLKKQSQFENELLWTQVSVMKGNTSKESLFGVRENKANQSQTKPISVSCKRIKSAARETVSGMFYKKPTQNAIMSGSKNLAAVLRRFDRTLSQRFRNFFMVSVAGKDILLLM